MTELSKVVRRGCRSGRDQYVVSLIPATGDVPPMVEVRVKGTRTPYRMTVGGLMVRMVDAELARRRAEKRGRRGAR